LETWDAVEPQDLLLARGFRMCITCEHFTYSIDETWRSYQGCQLKQRLLSHGEYLLNQCEHWTFIDADGVGSRH